MIIVEVVELEPSGKRVTYVNGYGDPILAVGGRAERTSRLCTTGT
jgi:hypothetical protein